MTHGPVPRCLGFPINNKVRLLALKTMLSSKLFEERLIIIDSEEIRYPKTTLLQAILEPYGIDKLLFLVPEKTNNNHFEMASRNLSNVTVKKAAQFNLPELIRNDYIFLTRQGLVELEALLETRESNYFRNKKVSTP